MFWFTTSKHFFNFICNAISNAVTSLYFTVIYFTKWSHMERVLLQKIIATSGTTLDLSNHDLYLQTQHVLTWVFAKIPESVTTLVLSDNNLDMIRGADLKNMFTGLPPRIETLVLSNNSLVLMATAGPDLALAFTGIPSGVKTLVLSGNQLGLMTVEKLAEIIKSIPKSIKTLVFSNNQLYIDREHRIIEAMNAPETEIAPKIRCLLSNMPSSVTTIDLSNNGLSLIPAYVLGKMFATAKGITTLNLSGESIPRKKLAKIFDAITSVDKFILDHNIFTINSLETQDLRQKCTRALSAIDQNKMLKNLRLNSAITPGLFFYGSGLLTRLTDFDKANINSTIVSLFQNSVKIKDENSKDIILPEDVLTNHIAGYLAPVDCSKLRMTCKLKS